MQLEITCHVLLSGYPQSFIINSFSYNNRTNNNYISAQYKNASLNDKQNDLLHE